MAYKTGNFKILSLSTDGFTVQAQDGGNWGLIYSKTSPRLNNDSIGQMYKIAYGEYTRGQLTGKWWGKVLVDDRPKTPGQATGMSPPPTNPPPANQPPPNNPPAQQGIEPAREDNTKARRIAFMNGLTNATNIYVSSLDLVKTKQELFALAKEFRDWSMAGGDINPAAKQFEDDYNLEPPV